MKIFIKNSKNELGKSASFSGAKKIIDSINNKGSAAIILATGASQFEMLDSLIQEKIDWSKVTCFHLDEYIGIDKTHPASFQKYLKERFFDKVNVNEFYFVDGTNDPISECERLNEKISLQEIDVAFIGIGENSHLAFNDPPADFKTTQPYIIVELDEDCRNQQFGEGWFPDIESVPKKAISMSINQIMKSKSIICTVPDKRKAEAVKNTIIVEETNLVPSTILKKHPNAELFLDMESSSLLTEGIISDFKNK